VDDLARARHVIDIEELDDLDVADDRDGRHGSLGLAESPRYVNTPVSSIASSAPMK
jgi:hypothetical protein